MSADPVAMMAGGLCWLDYDGDGWLDLYVVNTHAEQERSRWLDEPGGLPSNALFRNDRGRFVDVSDGSGADVAVRGNGCVAADLDGDGRTDLFVTTESTDVLLWNEGDGTFTDGTDDAGVTGPGWTAGAAAGDVDGDGRLDLFVAGYADAKTEIPGATAGFPNTNVGVRDLLYLNDGASGDGRPTFREVGAAAGLEVVGFEYGLGARLGDLDADGDLDLYVANDTKPNRLYDNVAWPGGAETDPAGLGFRFEEIAGKAGVADPNAGMGIGEGDFDGDGRPDLFVTNSRNQVHGLFRSATPTTVDPAFADARADLGVDLGDSTGWGTTLVDLDLDADLDLVYVNGAVPVTDLEADAEPITVLVNDGTGRFEQASVDDAGALVARGSAAADFDNDGDVDVAVNVVGGRLVLLENRLGGGHWLEVAAGAVPGTRVTIEAAGREQSCEIAAGGSYLSSEDPRCHFGLADATSVDTLIVRWPNGETTTRDGVDADRPVSFDPPGDLARPVMPAVLGGCERIDLEGRSVARLWDEVLLDSIRRDVPAPTVHARNLFHVSAAMWDAWAAFDRRADGYLVTEKASSDDIEAAREEAISYAAYRILLWRYSRAAGLEETFGELTSTMQDLCYPVDEVGTDGDSAAALGNRIAAAYIEHGEDDGSLEEKRYVDTEYRPVNAPLVVAEPAIDLVDADRWQPLALARFVAQNGVPVPGAVQRFIGPHWGRVQSFALGPAPDGLPLDPGPPPRFGDGTGAYEAEAVDVLRRSSELDTADGVVVDVGPGAVGDNPLGTNDGDGHDVNPVTGEPYDANLVLRGDFARVIAQFWADGPASETPPGHWNTIANDVVDSPGFERRIGGDGAEVDPLQYDVKLYFALNGAVHDAAVAAWGVKGHYDSVRPISMIRYLAAQGRLPLEAGLVEVITAASASPGQRHEHVADHIGEVAVRAWAGNPQDPANETSGVAWILASEWVPFQLPTFVSPAFAGYVSGHSTFSRAAAEVLTAFTGSEYFPGGLGEWTVEAGSLQVEDAPSQDVTIQAATYYDAADQAGISRLYGGIHIAADDVAGRRVGAQCGIAAWDLAQRFFAGTAV